MSNKEKALRRKSVQWSENDLPTVTPKRSMKDQRPVLCSAKLENVGDTQRPVLGCYLQVQFPSGAEEKVWADFDTRCDSDVIDTEAATRWKDLYKIPWGAASGEYKVMGGGTVVPKGSAAISAQVSSRELHHRIPRRLRLDLDCEIMDAPAAVVLGLPTLQSTGLLAAVLTQPGEGQFPELDDADGVDDWGAEFPEDVVWPKLRGSQDEQRQLMALCKQFPKLFGKPTKGGCKLEPLHIEVDEELARQYRPEKARPVSPAVLEDIREDIETRMSHGWMQRGNGRYASPIVAVRQPLKPRRRICGDYRKINAMTKSIAYPCKHVKKSIEELKGSQFFGAVDMYKGYYQLKLDKETGELLSIVTPDGLFEPITAPFGPKQVPAAFQQRISEQVLPGLERKGVVSYIDDMCIHAQSFEEFLGTLRELFERLNAFDLRLNGKKCTLGGPDVDFLGMKVDGKGVQHTENRKEAVKNLESPKTKKQLKSFLGMAGYFRSHIPNFARRAKVLTTLTKKDSPDKLVGVWGEQEQKAFQLIKQAMVDVEVLKFLDYSQPICMRTDASTDGCGAMLYQIIDGKEQPVAYLSKTFSAAERRWSTIEQETYAVYWAITSWDSYLLGQQFEVQTDHKNILWLYKSEAPKILRWRLRMQEYDFIVRHVAGRDNVVADCLSRVGQLTPAAKVAAAALKTDFQCDPQLLLQVFAFHNDVQGHLKMKAVERKMKEAGIRGPYLREHIKFVIDRCGLCQKIDHGQAADTPEEHISSQESGEEWSVDTIGPIEEDEDGNQFIIAAIDGFSRSVFMKATKTASAEEAAQFILELAGVFGLPKAFRSDNGSQYENHLISVFLALVGTERHPGIAYRPQSNGMIERSNKEIGRHLRFIIHSRRVRGKWSKYLPLVSRIINSSYNSSIGTSPCRVMFGNRMNLNRSLIPAQAPSVVQSMIGEVPDSARRTYIQKYVDHLIEAQEEIAKKSAEYQQGVLQKRIGDSSVRLDKNSWVVCSWPSGRPAKLSVLWKGPYRIKQLKPGSKSTYLCEDPADLKIYKFHISRLRPYKMGGEDPKTLIALDTEEHVVEKFVDHNCPGRKKSDWDFKVRWANEAEEEDSWIPWREAKKLQAMDAYARLHPELSLLS